MLSSGSGGSKFVSVCLTRWAGARTDPHILQSPARSQQRIRAGCAAVVDRKSQQRYCWPDERTNESEGEHEMTGKLKTLCVVLVAVFVIDAVAVSAASAATTTHLFSSDAASGKTTITGRQTTANQFNINGALLKCPTVTYLTTVTGTNLAELENVVPTYAGCTYAGEPATVKMEGCTYTFSGVTNAIGDGITKTVCPKNQHIKIEVPNFHCEITLIDSTLPAGTQGSQTALGGVGFAKGVDAITGKNDITMTLTAIFSVIPDTTTPPEFTLDCKNATGTGKWSGAVTLTGDNDNPTTTPVNLSYNTIVDP
jgi:hypothetical protein